MLTHKGTQKLETKRLILRRFTIEDARHMYDNWASDPEVTRFLTWPTHGSVDVSAWVLADWVEHYANENYYTWTIVLKENGDVPIGSISAEIREDKIDKAHIGYCIGKQWWHKGITSEALCAVIDFLFDEVGVQRIEARHDANNPNSGAVMRKCGMKYEGTLRRSDWNNQGICDACWYAVLNDERRVSENGL